MMRTTVGILAGLAALLGGWARAEGLAPPAALEAEIRALTPKDVPWRQIAWKKTLVAGLQESRKAGKPVILWVFIDRPADDERC